jgi:hypothetical protein
VKGEEAGNGLLCRGRSRENTNRPEGRITQQVGTKIPQKGGSRHELCLLPPFLFNNLNLINIIIMLESVFLYADMAQKTVFQLMLEKFSKSIYY